MLEFGSTVQGFQWLRFPEGGDNQIAIWSSKFTASAVRPLGFSASTEQPLNFQNSNSGPELFKLGL